MPWARVAVPRPLRKLFHYAVPPELSRLAVPGARVLVRFARRQVVAYVVERSEQDPPAGVRAAALLEVLDERPTFEPELLEMLCWMSRYYRAPLGEVLRAAHPSAINVRPTAVIALTPAGRAALAQAGAADPLPGQALALLEALAGADEPSPVGRLRPRPASELLLRLERAGLICRAERVEAARAQPRLEAAFQAIAPAPGPGAGSGPGGRWLRRDQLLAWLIGRGVVRVSEVREAWSNPRPHLRQLIAEGRARETSVEIPRDAFFGEVVPPDTPPALTSEQARAVGRLCGALGGGYRAFLLQGITGSGKTEVYLRAIEATLAAGRGALVLVPEIALTPQLVRRFRARLGDGLAVLHSGLGEGARLDQWRRLHAGTLRLAIGARSALFAPIADLGLVVVDESHDSSFKQDDGVRYNARDMALVRAQRAGAVVVLGSATPSMESVLNVERGKLERISLLERPTGGQLPRVELVDLTRHRPPRGAASFLSQPLRAAISDTLARGEQTILLLNRRGFSSFVLCTAEGCGQVVECDQCAISMTWHRGAGQLRCHYCDAARPLPERCGVCGSEGLSLMGQGTERLHDALGRLFPGARVARLDRDTASSGRALRGILGAMRRREIDILAGTQMVAKGHDFPAVTLVGVLAADAGLGFPDFRAAERTFQLLAQVAGRAGRGQTPGRVLVQTYDPSHPCLIAAAGHDHSAFASAELALRRALGYPPYTHAATVRIDGADPQATQTHASRAGALLATVARREGVVMRGPAPAPIERIRGRSRWALLLTAARRRTLGAVLDALIEADLRPPTRDVRLTIDVDPQSFM